MGLLPYSPEIEKIALSKITTQIEKDFYLEIINCFKKEGLAIKAKLMLPKKPDRSFYRVFCYIKKGSEALTMDGVLNGLCIHIRIENQNTFEKLSEYTDNIRNQFLNANDCTNIDMEKCHGKNRYIFTYNNHKYIKCKNICSNFSFTNLSKSDFAIFMVILNEEIEFNRNN